MMLLKKREIFDTWFFTTRGGTYFLHSHQSCPFSDAYYREEQRLLLLLSLLYDSTIDY